MDSISAVPSLMRQRMFFLKSKSMNKNDKEQRDWLQSMVSDFYLFVVIMTICIGFIMCCSACSSSRPVVLERTLHDTVHINNVRLDSVYMHDSIYFESIVKGDTIYRTKVITHWCNRISIKHDTVYAARENKTEVPVPVERKPPLWKQLAAPLYPIVFIIIIGIVSMIWLIHRKK